MRLDTYVAQIDIDIAEPGDLAGGEWLVSVEYEIEPGQPAERASIDGPGCEGSPDTYLLHTIDGLPASQWGCSTIDGEELDAETIEAALIYHDPERIAYRSGW